MKKTNIKSMITGIVIGIISTTTIFAGTGIKSAKYNDIEMTIDSEKVELKSPLISIVEEGEEDVKQYMQVREVLERVGFKVEWNEAENTIDVSSKAEYKSFYPEIEISIKERYINPETEEITLIMKNLTSEDLAHGDSYYIEVNENGRWRKCNTVGNRAGFTTVGHLLHGESQRETKINYGKIFGKLPLGEYRIAKDFYQKNEIIVKVEFEVRP